MFTLIQRMRIDNILAGFAAVDVIRCFIDFSLVAPVKNDAYLFLT